MHVHELNPWRTLIVLSIFVALIIVGFLTMSKPFMSYELNMQQSIEELSEANYYFYPWELESVINNESDTIILFDIRDRFVFGQGHIPGAENLTANDLTKEENIERLKQLQSEGKTVVLYGEDELQANGPVMVFREVGFDNVRLLLGGYNYYFEKKDDLYSTVDDDAYLKEMARFDYVEMAAPKNDGGSAIMDKQPVQVQRRQKTTIKAGGC